MKLIDKDALVAEIEKNKKEMEPKRNWYFDEYTNGYLDALKEILSFLDTFEVKEVTDEKTKWSPSKKQMESLRDMLKYNIGVFDYQKFMEVNSLYDDLTKILDYETD